MAIIEINHVTKEYRLGQMQSLKTVVLNAGRRLLGQPTEKRAPFKALDDVNFSIEPGEVVGIIGHNGAGKSTLLKLISGITQATRGSMRVAGSIAPLIEVGAGFIPDFTGRENIYLNGAILGIPKRMLDRKFDDIVAFAELEKFIDTPLKRYSSGMQVRLGFALATSMDADILIVDEVLAVGDLAFQRKCFDRIENIIRHSGKTILIVSHNIRQIERLCDRVLLLEDGHVLEDGPSASVCDSYYALMNKEIRQNVQDTSSASKRENSSGEVMHVEAHVLDSQDSVVSQIQSGAPLKIRVDFMLQSAVEKPEFHIGTHTTDFFYLTGSSSALVGAPSVLPPGRHSVEQIVAGYPVVPGTYAVRFAMLDKFRRVIYHGETLALFTVTQRLRESLQDELRIVDLPVAWSIDGQPLSESGRNMHDTPQALGS